MADAEFALEDESFSVNSDRLNGSEDSVIEVSKFFDHLTGQDELFEAQLLTDPYNVNIWQRYVASKQDAPLHIVCFIYERACRMIPRSYKLWYNYLDLLAKSLTPDTNTRSFEIVNKCFEKALILLNRMPRIWLMYFETLQKQPKHITKTRLVFDRALRALPLTQHDRIWAVYSAWALKIGGNTLVAVWKRYVIFDAIKKEELIDYLVKTGFYRDACIMYKEILDIPNYVSTKGNSIFQIWTDFCDLIVQHPEATEGLFDCEKIIRAGIKNYKDQAGKLWVNLATFLINNNELERARDCFDEGITTAMTKKDFSQVFDAYIEFEERTISFMIEENQDSQELELSMKRFEQLMDRRQFLINDVCLRQNINNIEDWRKRISLWGKNTKMVVQTYTEAFSAIDPKKAVGLDALWLDFASLYEKSNPEEARKIYEKATNVHFHDVNELANIWCGWTAMELRLGELDRARAILKKATQGPKISNIKYMDLSKTPQERIHKSSKLWMLYADVEEGSGSLESTKAIYDRMFELMIATPQTIVNYANYLSENNYFEESFKVFERGVSIFSYPVAFELWNLYIVNFLKRYPGTQIERTRDLFEQALKFCPSKFSKNIYLMYANFEEKNGSIKRSMDIYEQASSKVADKDKLQVFKVFLQKSAEYNGLLSTRKIYERAIDLLQDSDAREMCSMYRGMELRLGELDRARGIFAHESQFADPRIASEFWEDWHQFEVQHGNEDTYRDMLRIKRSVQAQYNTDQGYIASVVHNTLNVPRGFVPASQNEENK